MSEHIIFREAGVEDIEQIMDVRLSVKENTLPDPSLVTKEDCESFLTERGKGWVCELNGRIAGFAIVDLTKHNIWALFVRPSNENMGIGQRLHRVMLDWYFKQTDHPVWLGTSPGTKAEKFYRRRGWVETGTHVKEIKFEMTKAHWLAIVATGDQFS